MVVNPDRRTVIRWAALGAVGAAVAACGGSSKKPVAVPSTEPTKSTPLRASPSPTRVPGSSAVEVVSGPRTAQAVALTFHTNGDLGECHQLVQAANDNNAKITAFFVGNWLEANPSFAAAIKDGGHDFGNHTYSHRDPFATLDADTIYDEIVKCRDVLTRVMGGPGLWFRPSATDHANEVILAQAGRAGYATSVSYSVDPSDYKDPGAQTVVDRTMAAVKPGSIVSLHMGHPGTITALPQIITGLRAQGLACVTLTELLG